MDLPVGSTPGSGTEVGMRSFILCTMQLLMDAPATSPGPGMFV